MIKVENLSKLFGLKRAVDDVSFEAPPICVVTAARSRRSPTALPGWTSAAC